MINLGLLFEQSAISHVGRLRQLFIANPAISRTTLQKVIRQLPSLGGDSPDSRYKVQKNWFFDTPHRWNCAECARFAYHSWLYELPWVKCCPTHLTELVENCPNCARPWPGAYTLARKCDVCGVYKVRRRERRLAPSDSDNYHWQRMLSDCISGIRRQKTQLCGLWNESYASDEANVAHALFPCALHSQGVPPELLQRFGITVIPYRQVETTIANRPPWKTEEARRRNHWSAAIVLEVIHRFAEQRNLIINETPDTGILSDYDYISKYSSASLAIALYWALAEDALISGEGETTTTNRYGDLFLSTRPYPKPAAAAIISPPPDCANIGWLSHSATVLAYTCRLREQLLAIECYFSHVKSVKANHRPISVVDLYAFAPKAAHWKHAGMQSSLLLVKNRKAQLFHSVN